MRTLAFAVLSTIAAMMFTVDTAEAHWRPTTRIWRCPPCIFPPQYPRRSFGLFVSGVIGGTNTGISIVFSSPAPPLTLAGGTPSPVTKDAPVKSGCRRH
jgi:hypothetical protein